VTPREAPGPAVERIEVHLRIGDDRMAASDDPLFLRLLGPAGREFRLLLAKGKSLRRGQEDHYVIGSPESGDTNVAYPELNDPSTPPISLSEVAGIQLLKGLEPLPNVRGMGEMDDRLLLDEAEVVLHAAGGDQARFRRHGPLWLGLVCGLSIELARVGEKS
jgi:hypothetical protein